MAELERGQVDEDGLTEQQLNEALREVPKGALALGAFTIGTLMLAYFLIYLFVFLPRGTVG